MRVTGTPISGVIPSTPVAWATSHLLAVATGRILRIYAVEDSSSLHNPLAVLTGHTDAITTVISLPGMRIASASEDGTVRIWDVATGQSLRIFDLANPVLHMAYVHSEELLCLTPRALLHVRLTRDRSKRRRPMVRKLVSGILSAPGRLVVSADASVVAVSDSTKIHLTGLGAGGVVTTLRGRRIVTALAITSDGNKLAAADESGIISLYCNLRDLQGTKRMIVSFENAAPTQLHWHASAPQALTFAHDDSVLLSAGSEAVLVTWRLTPALLGTRTFLPRLRSAVLAISVSPDERTYAISQSDNAVRLIEQRSSGVVRAIRGVPTRLLDFSDRNPKALLSSRVNPQYIDTCSVAQDPEQRGMLWFAGAGPCLQFFDAFRGSLVDEIQIIPRNAVFESSHTDKGVHRRAPATVSNLALHPSGRFLATVDSQDMRPPHAQRYGTDTAMHVLKLWHRQAPDQSFVLDSVISQPHGSDASVSSLCFHPKLPLLVTTSRATRTFKMWRGTRNSVNGRTGWRNEIELDYKDMDCNGACFSSDGSLLIVACGHVLTMWETCDRLSVLLNETDRSDATSDLQYCTEASPRSVSVEFLHALVHPPSEERIVSLAFVFKSVPLIIAVTRSGIYVWNALSQSIWWSTRIRSGSQTLAVDPDSGRFALQLIIPSVGNDREDCEREPVKQACAADAIGRKNPEEGATTSPINAKERAPVSLSQNGSKNRKVEREARSAVRKSEAQTCTDVAVSIYDAYSPVPLHVHRLPTGAKVTALSFVKHLGQTNRSLSPLVCVDSRMDVFLYGADNRTISHSPGIPADQLKISKLQPIGNLERILGKETCNYDLSSEVQSGERLISGNHRSVDSVVDKAFRTHFHGLTHVQAPAGLSSFDFVNALLTSSKEHADLQDGSSSRRNREATPTNTPEILEADSYSGDEGKRPSEDGSSPTAKHKATVENSKDPDYAAMRTFCVSMIRKANRKEVPA